MRSLPRGAIVAVAVIGAVACAHRGNAVGEPTRASTRAPESARSGPRSAVADETLRDEEEAGLRAAGVDPGALRCNREARWGSLLRGDAREGAREILEALEVEGAAGSSAARATTPAPAREAEVGTASSSAKAAVTPPGASGAASGDRSALAAKIEKLLLWRMVRAVILEGDNHNFGALPLRGHTFRDEGGVDRPVLVFRSGFTPNPGAPGSCFSSLLEAGGVRHVVNLFDGEIPAADLVEAERRAAAARGATYSLASSYGPWRDTLRRHYDDPARRKEAEAAVARLIRDEILRPGGDAPKGNVHLHCGGGMHRTGIIAGILDRCVNRSPMEAVERRYRAHVAFRDETQPGGYEAQNVRFIREFDCALLDGL